MTPIQKAKEIIVAFLGAEKVEGFTEAYINTWLATPEAAALLSGEDWKEDGREKVECYVPVAVTKFGDLPAVMTEVVVFFPNRKEPFIGYREVDNVWYDETGQGTKTPTHWLKKTKL